MNLLLVLLVLFLLFGGGSAAVYARRPGSAHFMTLAPGDQAS